MHWIRVHGKKKPIIAAKIFGQSPGKQQQNRYSNRNDGNVSVNAGMKSPWPTCMQCDAVQCRKHQTEVHGTKVNIATNSCQHFSSVQSVQSQDAAS